MKLLKLHEGQYTVHAVCDERGEAQLLEFLEGLGANYNSNRNGMLNLLERCAEHGPPRNADLKHRLDDGIYELIKGQLRVVFFTDAGKLIICSHGFLKKISQSPAQGNRSGQTNQTPVPASKASQSARDHGGSRR